MTHTSKPGLDKPLASCHSVITAHSQFNKVVWQWSLHWTSDPEEVLGNVFLKVHSCMMWLHLRGFRTHGGSWRAALSVRVSVRREDAIRVQLITQSLLEVP